MRNLLKILTVLALIGFWSCDGFSTRTPEEPETSRSNFRNPDTPDIVINNLLSSFSNKNIVNFLRCFQDANFESNLKFTPSQTESASNPGFFSEWNLRNEEITMNNVFNSLEPNAIPFLSISNSEQQQNPLSTLYQADYYIIVNSTRDVETEYAGTLLFRIISETNDYWYISEWTDFSESSSTITSSWSTLKFNFGR